MSTEEQQPKVLHAAMLASAILAGCATLAAPTNSEQRLTAYLAKAQSQVDECVATARRMLRPPPGLRADRADGEDLCGEPKEEVEALFDDAERAVRLERGTHMYLSLYHERWSALMRGVQREEVATEGQLLQQERALEAESTALETIARKLSPSFGIRPIARGFSSR
jgi:hypothetical protein